MAWSDDPQSYYGSLDDDVALAQGDIVIAATAILFPGEGDSDAIAPTLGDHRVVRLWRGTEDNRIFIAPTISADVGWALAMVVPHACAMEKEWNERVVELIGNGISAAQAQADASADPELDPFVTIAAIRSYTGVAQKRERSIRSGSRLSAFPVVGNGRIPEGYVDLTALTTVRYTLVPVAQRVATLSSLAKAFFQQKLAMHFAYRDNSDLDAIARAVGRRIADVNVIEAPSKKSPRVRVAMTLDDGQILTLEGNAPQTRDPTSPERPPRGRSKAL